MQLPHPEDIRETVLRTFSELRRRAVSGADLSETILLRQGFYYGRSFRQGTLVATLIAESGTLCVCTDDGQVLRTVEFGAPTQADSLALQQAA
jgi:hypothetical protein